MTRIKNLKFSKSLKLIKMKKYLCIFLFVSVLASFAFAQAPEAFKYQAVVRNTTGEILANQDIAFKIGIVQNSETGNEVYSELHKARTNEFGLVSLEIGNGTRIAGEFSKINWADGAYFIKIEFDPKGGRDFTLMGTSKMLSVPYALNAKNGFSGDYNDLHNKPVNVSEFINDIGYVTREEWAKAGGTRTDPPNQYVNKYWNIDGNWTTNPVIHALGTNDSLPLRIITNGQNRMRFEAEGSATIYKALRVGKAFYAEDDVLLNYQNGNTFIYGGLTVVNPKPTLLNGSLTVNGITNLNNDFNVNNMSPSHLTGTLTVDKATNLNDLLNVNNMAPTHLTGTLTVEKATNLNNLLNVNNASPTVLTGTLRVDQNATFKQMVTLDNAGLGSSSYTTGALVVAGGVGIGQNLNVAGTSTFGGNANFLGIVNFSNTTQSTANNNGAVIIGGGLGLAKNLNMGGDLNINTNKFNVASATGNTLIAGTLGVTGATLLGNTLGVTGATTLANTLTVAGATTVNNTSALNGQVTINANVGGGEGSYGAYPLRVQGSDQGIAIKLNAGTPNNSNNFVTFFNGSGAPVGRIEGETLGEHTSQPQFIYDEAILSATEVEKGVALGLAAIPVVVGGLIASTGPCGACLAMAAADLALATADLISFNVFETMNIGVTYESGSADYAEWLERSIPAEQISAGDIVSVAGGKISKNTQHANKYMVVSTKPAILGNMPEKGKENQYNKVAFLGQIPVKVRGNVFIGDYILPSGLNDGTGRAISPNIITADQYHEIVGVAWSGSIASGSIALVNMAIGLNNNDLAKLAATHDKKIAALEDKYSSLESRLTALEGGNPLVSTQAKAIVPNKDTKVLIGKTRDGKTEYQMPAELDASVMQDAITYLKKQYEGQKISMKNHPGLEKLFTDPNFQADVIKRTQDNYKITYQSYMDVQSSKK